MASVGHTASGSRVSRSPAAGQRGRGAPTSIGTTHRAKPSSSKGCAHVASKTKYIIDRLKVLVPYANVCQHRQALLQGRRGAQTATMGSSENRETTPAPTSGGDGDRSRKRLVEEMPAPSCFTCHTPVDRLHVCLSCDYFGCWRPRRQRSGLKRKGAGGDEMEHPHIVSHLTEKDHQFALDFVHLELYCRDCADYVYEPAVSSWLMATHIRWHAALCDSAEPEAKRPRIVSTGSDLSPAQAKYLKEHGAVKPCSGIRGLYNLGATCYLSVVLQALIHNPLMRGWMLSDGHHPSKCRVGRPEWIRSRAPSNAAAESANNGRISPMRGRTSSHANDDDAYRDEDDDEDEVMLGGGKVSLNRHTPSPSPASSALLDQAPAACMACELEASFQAFYSGDPSPFGPVRLLHTMWLLRSDLAGYGQQDAHECLMAMLDTLHVGFTENVLTPMELADESRDLSTQPLAMRVSKKQGSQYIQHTHLNPCPCLIHQAFAGVLQSTVTCSKCGNVTHAHDPMLDISLDIPIRPPAKKDSSGGLRQPEPMVSTSYRMTPPCSYSARSIDVALNEWLESKQSRSNSSSGSKYRKQGGAYDSDDASSASTSVGGKNSGNARSVLQTSMTGGQHPIVTLQDCLAHYTRAEQLQAGSYMCSRCKSDSVSAVKQLCIKELPPVLTFQLKRFEHHNFSGNHRTHTPQSSKVDAFVRLPLHLDMTPYTASALAAHHQAAAALKASAGNATTNTGNALPGSIAGMAIHDVGAGEFMANGGQHGGVHLSGNVADELGVGKDTPIPVLDGPGGSTTLGKRRTDATHSNPSCQYTLFAVIDHIGHLDTGHYTAYAQHRGQWYMFDDATVTKVDIKDVLGYAEEAKVSSGRAAKGKAYMAFYVKSVLDYHDGAMLTTLASGSVMPPASVSAMPPGIGANAMAGMGVSNTRISENGEWIEDAGVVRTRINPNGDVKVERRGRKKGSTNAARKANPTKDLSSTRSGHLVGTPTGAVLQSGEVPTPLSAAAKANAVAVASAKKKRGRPSGATSSHHQPSHNSKSSTLGTGAHNPAGAYHEEGELEAEEGELGEYMAQGSLDIFGTPAGASAGTFGINPMALSMDGSGTTRHRSDDDNYDEGNLSSSPNSHSLSPSSSDSDGEALWARMSKEKAMDDLVPMFSRNPPVPPQPPTMPQGVSPDTHMYVDPSDLASSPANKSAMEFDDDNDDNSDYAL
ncbi:cysteine proteinase [Martensiomyces pterosporus]|nr:cysteine proteinase [Martensiomyces pterosporus]